MSEGLTRAECTMEPMRALHAYDGYLFDLDGTIYSGNTVLPGALATLNQLRDRGKAVLFVTNTTVRTKEQVRERLQSLGIACEDHEVMTALCVSAQYFQEFEPSAQVLMIGEEAMRLELERSGVATTADARSATHVLVGLDRQLTYDKLTLGMAALRSGAKLIASNPDPFCPLDDGAIPDTWAIVKALETASLSKTCRVVGKPSAYYAQKALNKLKLPPAQCLMVGDRVETDIRLGLTNGMATALVLTGADTARDAERAGLQPDYVLETLAEIML
ncbi:HAD-IIA family hydrolase [Paenibacillus chartarius]|uniref:Acid sugar phosphatase n=1 Tax=Paenibacillus chartarius TaxID=747481 RepID=A0ABV6DGI4_9BACL